MAENKYYGFHRAQVIDSKDPGKHGKVKVFIPDLQPTSSSSDNKGLWAKSANNPISGLNSDGNSNHHYMGSTLIPQNGSWIDIF